MISILNLWIMWSKSTKKLKNPVPTGKLKNNAIGFVGVRLSGTSTTISNNYPTLLSKIKTEFSINNLFVYYRNLLEDDKSFTLGGIISAVCNALAQITTMTKPYIGYGPWNCSMLPTLLQFHQRTGISIYLVVWSTFDLTANLPGLVIINLTNKWKETQRGPDRPTITLVTFRLFAALLFPVWREEKWIDFLYLLITTFASWYLCWIVSFFVSGLPAWNAEKCVVHLQSRTIPLHATDWGWGCIHKSRYEYLASFDLWVNNYVICLQSTLSICRFIKIVLLKRMKLNFWNLSNLLELMETLGKNWLISLPVRLIAMVFINYVLNIYCALQLMFMDGQYKPSAVSFYLTYVLSNEMIPEFLVIRPYYEYDVNQTCKVGDAFKSFFGNRTLKLKEPYDRGTFPESHFWKWSQVTSLVFNYVYLKYNCIYDFRWNRVE